MAHPTDIEAGIQTRELSSPRGRPELVIIVALAEGNRVIGSGNDLPWHIPEDLKRFKRLTTGHAMIVGRRTFESIIHQFGAPLPNRRFIVVTSKGPLPNYPHIETVASIDEALEAVTGDDLVYIGGGATIYEQFLPMADRLELTIVEGEHVGDTYFPEYEHLIGREFELVDVERHDGFRFETYRRIER